MIGKAAGMDGWTAKALHFLPDKLWARLCSVLQAVEATHTWPRSMYQWRICFLPKGTDTITTVQSTRPIAIGHHLQGLGKVQSKTSGGGVRY